MAINWRVYGTDTVAAVLDKGELTGFFRQAVVRPNEAALVIRNGSIEEVVTEKVVRTSGFRDRLLGLLGQPRDAQVIFVDTSPFALEFCLGETSRGGFGEPAVSIMALSADRQPVTAQVRMTLSVGIDDAELLTRLLRGKAAVAVWDVALLVQDELLAKVLIPRVGQHRADELRGNVALLQQLANWAEHEMSAAAELWGLKVERFFVNWGVTEQERVEIDSARKRRGAESVEFAHQRLIREKERSLELERSRLTNLQELRALEAQGGSDLKELYLAAEIERGRMVDGQRLDQAKIDAEIRRVELGVKHEEAGLQLEIDRHREVQALDLQRRSTQDRVDALKTQSDIDMGGLQNLVKIQDERREQKHLRELELRRLENDRQFAQRQQDLEVTRQRIQTQQDVLAQAIEAGTSNPSVLITFLEQATEQEYARTSDSKVQARVDAQGARYAAARPLTVTEANPTAAPTANQEIADLVDRSRRSVVRIVGASGSGSGFVVDPQGLIFTNAHVLDESGGMYVVFHDGRGAIPTVVASDAAQDVALLKVDVGGSVAALPLGRRTRAGEEVLAFGFPLGIDGDMTATKGIVSALRRSGGTTLVQTDAALNPGNSGGPLVNVRGQAVGMNTSVLRGIGDDPAEGIGFAIGAEALSEFLRSATSRTPVSNRAACPACWTPVQPNWNNCPRCSTKL